MAAQLQAPDKTFLIRVSCPQTAYFNAEQFDVQATALTGCSPVPIEYEEVILVPDPRVAVEHSQLRIETPRIGTAAVCRAMYLGDRIDNTQADVTTVIPFSMNPGPQILLQLGWREASRKVFKGSAFASPSGLILRRLTDQASKVAFVEIIHVVKGTPMALNNAVTQVSALAEGMFPIVKLGKDPRSAKQLQAQFRRHRQIAEESRESALEAKTTVRELR